MRRTASEKMEIIRLVEGSDLPVRATLQHLGVPRSTFYGWYQRYEELGFDGLHDKKPTPRPRWNAIPEPIQLIKAVKCFMYQACETDDWEQSEAFAFCQGLISKYICKLPGYDAAEWGAPCEGAHSDY